VCTMAYPGHPGAGGGYYPGGYGGGPEALTTMGFRLSPQAVNSIAKRYSTNGKITFDDYIACCVKLRALTAFKDGILKNLREYMKILTMVILG
uniref:Sorcin n=1 Tax=Suricata suricatta TaxID=37032 RepID=A0A673VRF9_SURSU